MVPAAGFWGFDMSAGRLAAGSLLQQQRIHQYVDYWDSARRRNGWTKTTRRRRKKVHPHVCMPSIHLALWEGLALRTLFISVRFVFLNNEKLYNHSVYINTEDPHITSLSQLHYGFKIPMQQHYVSLCINRRCRGGGFSHVRAKHTRPF